MSFSLRSVLLGIFLLATTVAAQQCSASTPCSVGCCSKHGYCGFGDDFCGSGCLNNCNAQKQCDQNKPCSVGCCSKFGFCGLGESFCGKDCAYQCDQKAQCDPGGWGSQYVNFTKCPLNVCCSKFGFCGMTSEFCGDVPAPKPKCGADGGSLSRVIGYYEGWAQNRPCNRMYPENIPIGVYTHINFAFGSIDPVSLNPIPASPGDTELWERVVARKRADPNLKIWLAIGGWTFNDPEYATKNTFGDISASAEKQDKFIKALMQLMSWYNFDGIDIDWEYPGAPDRAGRKGDFENFPFLVHALKSAMMNTNNKWGLSVTLPASFWYLQHFDIALLQHTVDWFNIMTYDMHGDWDLTTDWGKKHGATLNPHTNLTEISDGLDLLWRNDIEASKVNMGLAFYGRSMQVTSTSCNTPGCSFKSAGTQGPCSRTAGVLLNPEISDIISSNGLTPVLDRTSATKMVTWGDQWVSFDDGDTFKIKTDFAKSRCMGGVMVWAISHDTNTADNAVALANALGRPVTLPTTTPIPQKSTENPQDKYCRFMNCGEGCPAGFEPVIRQDDPSQLMMTGQHCPPGTDSTHVLCCPKKTPTFCRWNGHRNSGNCDAGCGSDEVQIGTTNVGCKGGHQAACCTNNEATAPWGQCKWFGDPPNCAPEDTHASCPSDYPVFVAESTQGFGGEQMCQTGRRAWCCKGTTVPEPFQNCKWHSHATSLMGNIHETICEDSCPLGQIRIASQTGGIGDAFACFASYAAYCCAGATKIEERSPPDLRLAEFQFYLDAFLRDPLCPVGAFQEMAKRHDDGVPTDELEAEVHTFAKRAVSQAHFSRLNLELSGFLYQYHQEVAFVNYFDSALYGTNPNMATSTQIRNFLYPRGWNYPPAMSPEEFIPDFLCGLSDSRQAIAEQQSARTQLCEYPSLALKATEVDPETFSATNGSMFNSSAWRDAEAASDVEKRGFNALQRYRGNGQHFSGRPGVVAALRGIRDGNLTFHYARWFEFSNNGEYAGELGLEVAYWIGRSVGAMPDSDMRDLLTERDHDRISRDRWVVFHLHIPINRGPRFSPQGHLGASAINVFHGQRLRFRGTWDWRVDSAIRGRFETVVTDPALIGRDRFNDRATVINCDDPTRIWIGASTVPDTGDPSLNLGLVWFGRHLVNTGIIDANSLAWIFPDAGTLGNPQPWNNRRYDPRAGAFSSNWAPNGGSGASIAWPDVDMQRDSV